MKAIETKYAGYLFRSRQEARHAVFFDVLGISYRYEYEGYDLDGIYYLPDFYLPQLDCYVEIKGQEPTTDERTKAKLLALHTAKRVYTFYGDLWFPEESESYQGMCDEPPSISAGKETGEYFQQLVNYLPPDLIEVSAQLSQQMIDLVIGKQSIGFISTAFGYHEATLSDNLQAYLTHLQQQQDVLRTLQAVLLRHEQELQQLMQLGERYHISFSPSQWRKYVVWGECRQCGTVQLCDAGRQRMGQNVGTGEPMERKISPRPIGSWCRCSPGLPTYTTQSPQLLTAYTAARQARFENSQERVPPYSRRVPLSRHTQESGLPQFDEKLSATPFSSEQPVYPFTQLRSRPQRVQDEGTSAPGFTLEGILTPNLIAEMTFSTFKPQVRGSAKPWRAAMDFAANPQGWFVFTGLSGCGKTHLAMSIAHQCLDAGHQVLYFSEPDFLDYLRASFHDTASYRFDDLFPRIQQGEILVLDDMGIQRQTTWVKEIREKLFTYRFDQKLPTVLVFGAHQDLQGVFQLQQPESMIHLVKMEGVTDYRLRQDRRPTKDRPTS